MSARSISIESIKGKKLAGSLPSSLILGSIASFLIMLLHIVLAVRLQFYRYFNAAELAEMHEEGSPFTVLVTLGLAVMFTIWGVYGLSGAGVIGQLPVLHALVIAIGVVYILRGLMPPSEIFKVLQRGYPARFVVLSVGSFAFGLLYLFRALA
jgi:hypothetical protein